MSEHAASTPATRLGLRVGDAIFPHVRRVHLSSDVNDCLIPREATGETDA